MHFTFLVVTAILSSLFNLYETSTVSNVPITSTPGLDPCIVLDQMKDLKWRALENRFPKGKRKINFALIVDRSKSIVTDGAYNKSIQLSIDLMNFLIRSRRMYIHPDYARIAIVSFGRTLTPEFDGITSSSRATSGCEVINRIESLYGQRKGETASFLSYAINKTAQLFKERDLGNVENTNIMWIFNDGEDENVKGAVDALSPSVVRFVVGLGQWLDNSDEANILQSLGSDKDHVACLDAWSKILKEETTTEPDAEGETVYAQSQSSDCPNTCAEGKQCACDVILTTHSCQDEDQVTDCLTSENCFEESDSIEGSGGNIFHTNWFIIMVVVLGIVVIIIIIGVACCCVRRKKDNPAPNSQPPARESLDTMLTSMPQENAPPTPVTAQSLPPNRGHTIPQRAAPPPPVPPRSPSTLVPPTNVKRSKQEDYENLDTEENMPGWGEHLAALKKDKNLNGIFVHTVLSNPNKYGAWTSGFQLTKQQQKEIERTFTNESRPISIKIATSAYILDPSNLSQLSFHGSRTIKRSQGTSRSEDIFAGVNAGYVIVVTADAQYKDACETVFYEIQQYLLKKQNNNDNSDITGDENYENVEMG